MSSTRWAEYLDGCADHVHSARLALDGGREVPVSPVIARPSEPVPEEYAWKLLQLVAEVTSALGNEQPQPARLVNAYRSVTHRALGRARHSEPPRAT